VLTATLSNEAFLSWGWRVAFLLSAVLVAFGLWIRLRLEDTPVFRALEAAGDRSAAPVRDVLARERRGLLAAILARIGPDVCYSLFTVYVLTYATRSAGFSRAQVLTAVLIGSALQLAVIPGAGALSDRIRRRTLSAVAVALGGVWVFVFFALAGTGSVALLVIGVVVGLALHAAAYGPQAAFITEQFSPALRSTGASLGYTVAAVFGGAIAPLAFTALQGAAGGWVLVAVYVAVASALSVLGLLLGRDYQPSEEEQYLAAAAPLDRTAG
jgi:MFS family permease